VKLRHEFAFAKSSNARNNSTAMANPVKPIPDFYRAATPYLVVRGAAKAIDFYKQAFGATEYLRMPGPNGTVMHAEVRIGSAPIMLTEEMPQWGAKSPEAFGGSPVFILIYVENVDAVFAQAVAAGAKVMRPVQDQFYGDRAGTLTDPFGHSWTIATHKEDVPHDQLEKRAAAMRAECKPA
jgi:PhnB protein